MKDAFIPSAIDFEDGPHTESAPQTGCAVQVAARITHNPTARIYAIRATGSEVVQDCFGAIRRQFENGAEVTGGIRVSEVGSAVKIPALGRK